MLSIVLVGTGNIAENLFHALRTTQHSRLIQIVGRNPVALQKFQKDVQTTSDLDQIAEADIYILAVSDSAIRSVSQKLSQRKGIVVHTSGATPMDALVSERKGVFYPLQTFTKGRILDFSGIPICIEASDVQLLETLREIAKSISKKVYEVNSEKRKKLHIAAVFTNNFSNHLFHIGEMICEEDNLPFELLKPLLLETVQKLEILSPFEAQTGPARRKDIESMRRHLEQLSSDEHKKLYRLLSESIAKTYEEKL